MKKTILIILLMAALIPLGAAERVFVSTDRSIYIAGENLFCSLFCIETETMQPSGLSALAYLEIASAETTAATAKIALLNGHGAGIIQIPAHIPSGNYVVYAYTTAGGTENCLAGSRTISVFNTTSNARTNVQIVSDSEYSTTYPADASSGLGLVVIGQARSGKDFEIALSETLGNGARVSLSVFRIDDIGLPENGGVRAFTDALRKEGGKENPGIAEYEGEIVRATVKGGTATTAILSSAGSPTDVYIGKPDKDGHVKFFTNNIYGDRELVCSVDSPNAYLSFEDSFLHPSAGSVPALRMAPSLFSSLVARKTAAADAPAADTLVSFLPRRKDNLTEALPLTRYHLDDYTRFHSLNEIFVEIARELSIGKSHGKEIMRLGFKDPTTGRYYLRENILVMLDGVVLPEITPLKKMDAMLFSDIDIYYGPFAMGGVSFNGIVNFVTKQNYVKVIDFPAGVRVVDFKGVCAPVAYLGSSTETDQDQRMLLFWHPAVCLDKEETLRFSLKAPSRPGHFAAVAEGFDGNGAPVYAIWNFNVL